MTTLRDLLANIDRPDTVAVRTATGGTPHSYGEFRKTAWKAGNLLRHYGVRPGTNLAVVPGSREHPATSGQIASPTVLQAILGGCAVGATVDLTPTEPVSGRALVLPTPWLERYETEPGCSVLGYGEPPDTPGVAHFEAETWSENPVEPPGVASGGDPALRADGDIYTNATLIEVAETLCREYGMEEAGQVHLAAPVTDPGAFVAGALAPLRAGITIEMTDQGETHVPDGELVVSASETGERRIDPSAVRRSLRDTARV